MSKKNKEKKEELAHITIIQSPWDKGSDDIDCVECATSCQSACKTSCTVGNIPCEKKR